mmetsp:Transcript_23740/g.39221  ORF Transcript_23740/g.39221 Transcript_23740/m.39221 type:complete len:98 (-) Transcript_23740:2129-2422(-)
MSRVQCDRNWQYSVVRLVPIQSAIYAKTLCTMGMSLYGACISQSLSGSVRQGWMSGCVEEISREYLSNIYLGEIVRETLSLCHRHGQWCSSSCGSSG